jgi:hypothetical protein
MRAALAAAAGLLGALAGGGLSRAAISAPSASNDDTRVFYGFQYTGTPTYQRVYIDTDRNPTTGYAQGGVGADYLLENASLYRHTGSGWSWQLLKTVTFSASAGAARWTVARADIGEAATPNDSDLVFQTEAPLTTSAKLTQTFTSSFSGSFAGQTATNDAANVYYGFQYAGAPAYRRVYVDTDRSAATGYTTGGIGAEYLVENATLYRYLGPGWNWRMVKTVAFSAAGGAAQWTVARADLGETATPNDADLLFQIEAPLTTAARFTHTYSGNQTVAYAQGDGAVTNPERGFYRHPQAAACDQAAFDQAELQSFRTDEGITLIMCMFYLRGFQSSPISAAALGLLQQQADTVRAAGLKMILRFAYTMSEAGDDAPAAQVAAHLDQLAPFLASNSDVIYVMPVGFIGAFGEGRFTQNYGDVGVISAADWANRKAVSDKLLAVLPPGRMAQLRTPLFKRTMYGTAPVSAAQAYAGGAAARLGHHNDCFLASDDDVGTYADPATEYPYLAADTAYVPMGGETCGPNPPRSSCPTALSELKMFHWSYLNIDFDPDNISDWTSGGCLPEIGNHLGYRLSLQSATVPEAAHPGASLPVSIAISNDGWAAPSNPRPVELWLRNVATGDIVRLPLDSADPRRWAAGTTVTVSQALAVPAGLAAGSYALLLALPDAAPALRARPEYAIRLANPNVWDAASGANDLRAVVNVK